MTTRGRGLVAAMVGLLLVALVASGGAASATDASPPDRQPDARSEHERSVAFWTHARVAQAKPRDFTYDAGTNRFVPDASAKGGKPGGGGGGDGGGSVTVTGASWTGGGQVLNTTGKVLFALGSSYYVCSASVAGDASDGVSVILTAAHCVYDHDDGYATNWVFIPSYDTAPEPLSTDSSKYCPDTTYGCWTAASLHVRQEYVGAGGFNSTAIPYDFAFVRANAGGHLGTSLDTTVGSQAIAFNTAIVNDLGYAFGYPAAGKYNGKDLIYCAGAVALDPYQDNATYALGCDMTGGSSGGPWFEPFTPSTGTGTLVSVNSYIYKSVKKIHGPKLGTAAEALYNEAVKLVRVAA